MLLSRPIIARTLPFAVFLLFLGLHNFLINLPFPLLDDTRWLYGIRVAIVAMIMFIFWDEFGEIRSECALSGRLILTSVIAGLLVLMFWIAPYPDWAKTQHSTYFDPHLPNGQGLDWTLVAVRWSGAALVVPLMEELFWRSFLMRWLQDKHFLSVNPTQVRLFAFVATAGLFAMEHSLWLAGLIAGLAYGGLYRFYGTLWAPMIAHTVTNGLLGVWVIVTGNWRYW